VHQLLHLVVICLTASGKRISVHLLSDSVLKEVLKLIMIHNLNKDVKRDIMDKDIAIKEIERHDHDIGS